MSTAYLAKVRRLANDALLQAKAITPCAVHQQVLLYSGDSEADRIASGLAAIWLKNEVGWFMPEDLKDAIRDVLKAAARNGCPECNKSQA